MEPNPRKRASSLVLAALAALLLAACGGGDDGAALDPGSAASAPDYGPALAKAPPVLKELYGDGEGGIVEGGREAFDRELAGLRDYPVVINKWASWCGPCREEFPELQSQAAEHAAEVAFIGLNANDSTEAAETFLRDHPVPYPSFSDPDQEISRSYDATNFPETIFLDRTGEVVHIRRGPYTDPEELAADIDRYALSE